MMMEILALVSTSLKGISFFLDDSRVLNEFLFVA